MTATSAMTGTDRLADAAEMLDYDFYINAQSDESLNEPNDILRIAQRKAEGPELIVNGFCYLGPDEDSNSPNIPNVVTTENNELVYISRSAVPGFKDPSKSPKTIKSRSAFARSPVFICAFMPNLGAKA